MDFFAGKKYGAMDQQAWRILPSLAHTPSRSFDTGVVNNTIADGSVHSISESVDLNIWRAYSTRSGGEVVQIHL